MKKEIVNQLLNGLDWDKAASPWDAAMTQL